MSKLLKRALKLSFTPAVVLIVSKFIALITIIAYQGLDFSVGNSVSSIFSVQVYLEDQEIVTYANSISNIVAFIAIGLPLLYMVFKTTLRRRIQDNPKTIVKLTRFNLLSWITKDDMTFMTTFIWTVYFWIISTVILAQSFSGLVYEWMGVVAGVGILMSVWGLLRTFEKETAKIYPKDNDSYI
jgi:hypothetical protein